MNVYLDTDVDADNLGDYLEEITRRATEAWNDEIEWKALELWRHVQDEERPKTGFDVNDPILVDEWSRKITKDITRPSMLFSRIVKP